jgi:hypothetical protein
MNEETFLTELTGQIMAQGYDEATASDYAVLIGDCPIKDDDGHIVVMDDGKIVATLKPLRMFAKGN